ncbi:FUSC family protein, partial [Methylobacterium sp. Leaf89]|uniref:FUSC family protein n=1 Tax=Methylobacterium sp. Leaf89 TaxID=1736245 RepID=UPI001FCD54BA
PPRHVRAALARLPAPSPAVAEARALCLGLTEPEADPALAVARLSDLVAEAVRAGDQPLDAILALQRALDFARAAAFAANGSRVLAHGGRPLRDVPLPTHRDVPEAVRGALRVVIAFGLTALLLVATGWPATSFALVQVAATCSLSAITPDPRVFAKGVLIGMPLAALCAGLVLFGALAGVQGFPLLAIAMAPVVFAACFLSLNPPTFGIGFILLVFFPVLLSPANPQSYDPQGFLTNAFLVIFAALILFFTVRIILPISNARHRAFALDSARRALVEALVGRGGDATTRTSLNSDRLLQFARWSSGSAAVRRASLDRAFELARMESAAARAQAQLRGLARDGALAAVAGRARAALASVDAGRMREAAAALLAAGGPADPATRLHLARAVSDLATVAHVAEGQGRFLRRLGIRGA